MLRLKARKAAANLTQIKLLAEALMASGCAVFDTARTGRHLIGDQIREVLHDLRNREMHPRAEILLYNAARADRGTADQTAVSARRHRAALCDRFADSTVAYQGYGRGLDLDDVRHIVAFATQHLKPDLTLYLDIDVEAGLERRRVGGGEWNRMDDQAVEFYRRVRDGYLKLMADEPQRWVKIDAARSVAEVQQEIWRVVQSRIVG
ncbi:MAG: dTMP kinase [Anaerolineae bacterium]